MNRLIKMSFVVLMSIFSASNLSAAPILSFDASNADINKNYFVGDEVQLELWISGLASSDLGGFDLTLSFDPAITSYQSASFAPELDDQDFIVLEDWLADPSTLILTGVSLASDLSAQADAFRIATLAFTALGAGTGWVSFDSSLLSNELAEPFAATSFGAAINVSERQVAVSEPSPLLLLLGAVLALQLRRFSRP